MKPIVEQTRDYLASLPKTEQEQMAEGLIDKEALKEKQMQIWKHILDNNN